MDDKEEVRAGVTWVLTETVVSSEWTSGREGGGGGGGEDKQRDDMVEVVGEDRVEQVRVTRGSGIIGECTTREEEEDGREIGKER